MTRPKSRDIRAQCKDKEMFKHFGWGTEFKGEGEEESPPYDPAEFDITEADSRKQSAPWTARKSAAPKPAHLGLPERTKCS